MNGRVDFMVVGAQKAGTTALFEHLAQEPGLALSSLKEVHFFDDESLDWAAPDYDRYHRHFPAPDGRLRGEATPIYSYWPNALERIAAYNPAARLILVLRDPVERAWSHWKMEYARGAETQPFAWCIREGRQRLFAADPWGHHRVFSYVERGFYAEQVARIDTLFPRDQLLILTAETLRQQPAAALDRVRGFLGLPPGPPAAARIAHQGLELDYGSELTPPDVAYLRAVYAGDAERLSTLTGLRFG